MGRIGVRLLAVALCLGVPALAEGIGWQEAVARLRQERSEAVLCAGVLKRYGSAGEVARGALTYGEARAQYDGVIAGLVTALAGDRRPTSLPDLDQRLTRGTASLTAFCEQAKALLPPVRPGEKGIAEEITKGAVGPVVEAIAKIVDEAINGPPGRRETIRTQLEEAAWPPFQSVSPSS